VVEKVFSHYATVEIVQVTVRMLAPQQKVAGTLSAYKPIQYCMVPYSNRTNAFGSSFEGFADNALIPPNTNHMSVSRPSQEARKHSVPSVINPFDLLT